MLDLYIRQLFAEFILLILRLGDEVAKYGLTEVGTPGFLAMIALFHLFDKLGPLTKGALVLLRRPDRLIQIHICIIF